MSMRTVRWGGLNVQLVEPAETVAVTRNVILCHGYGAPGEDLVPLATMLGRFEPSLQSRVRFLFPQAPLDLAEIGMPGGRAWWNIDMWRLQQAVSLGAYRDLASETPQGLPAAREMMFRLLQDCERETGLAVTQTVIGGFSQGAMLSTDVALHLPVPVAGLVLLSGTLINLSVWAERFPHLKGVPVYQSHGTFDPILPFEFAARLCEELRSAGNPVDFYEFPGQHEIPFEAMQGAAQFLARQITG